MGLRGLRLLWLGICGVVAHVADLLTEVARVQSEKSCSRFKEFPSAQATIRLFHVLCTNRARHDPGLAEGIILSVLASVDPVLDATSLREGIDIWQGTGCLLEEAAARVVTARIGAPIAHLDADLADQMLRDYGVDVESRRAAGPLGVLVCSFPAVSIQTLGASG
jgi:hypothetical protein